VKKPKSTERSARSEFWGGFVKGAKETPVGFLAPAILAANAVVTVVNRVVQRKPDHLAVAKQTLSAAGKSHVSRPAVGHRYGAKRQRERVAG